MFQEKCYPYWYPKGKVVLADSLSINVLHEKSYAFYTTRKMKIEDREVIDLWKMHYFINFNSGIKEIVIKMVARIIIFHN